MIVVDASALVAILLNEEDGPIFREALLEAGVAHLSPVGYWETVIRLHRFRGSAGVADLERLMGHLNIDITPATSRTARLASDAELAFGKRTPAKLNLGDCFAYALARELDAPFSTRATTSPGPM